MARRGVPRTATALVAALVVTLTGCHGGGREPAGTTAVGRHTVRDDLGTSLQGVVDGDTTGLYDRLLSIVVTVDGRTVYQRYRNRSTADTPIEIDAVGVTILGTLVGIALADGDLSGLDARLDDLLPDYRKDMSPRAAAITVRQLLGMTAGLQQDDLYAAELAGGPNRDRVRWILDHDVVGVPGDGFSYSRADSDLLAAALGEATGGDLLAYARTALFDPLGIDVPRSAWPRDGQDRALSGGQWLTPPDLVKLGQLWLDRGAWHGRQLVPAAWIDTMSRQYQFTGTTEKFPGYGYHVWTDTADGHPAVAAAGLGGQLVEVVPELGLVAVFASKLTPATTPADLVGAAGATNYSDLVDLDIAPRIT